MHPLVPVIPLFVLILVHGCPFGRFLLLLLLLCCLGVDFHIPSRCGSWDEGGTGGT